MGSEVEGGDRGLIREAIRRESERGERLVAKLRAAMHTAVMLGAIVASQVMEVEPEWRPLIRYLPLAVPIVLVMSWGWLWFVHTRPYRREYGFVSAIADALVLVVVMVVTSLGMGVTAADSNLIGITPPLVAIFFVVAAAGLRQDPALCVAVAVVAIVGFAAALSIATTAADLARIPPEYGFFATPPIWIGRGIVFAFTAAVAALAARNAQRMAESAAGALAEQARVTQLFGRYVDPEIARGVLSRGGAAEVREVTVLFTDLRGFTTMSEQLTPGQTLEVLNAHYAAIVPVVHRHGGTVNKFIGDAIMATFGAPMVQPDHALRAVRAATDMLTAMEELNAGFRRDGRPALEMGIGIATGQVIVGSLGDRNRVEYAVIGDTVNTAARLEAKNKDLATRLLISQATQTALGDALATRALGEVTLRGTAAPVAVYTVGA